MVGGYYELITFFNLIQSQVKAELTTVFCVCVCVCVCACKLLDLRAQTVNVSTALCVFSLDTVALTPIKVY